MDDQRTIDYRIVGRALLDRAVVMSTNPDGTKQLRVTGIEYSEFELRSIVTLAVGEEYEIVDVHEYEYGTQEAITMVVVTESRRNETPPRADE